MSTSSSVLSSLGWTSLSVNLGTMPLHSVLWLLTPRGDPASFWGLEAKAAGVGGDSAAPYLRLDLFSISACSDFLPLAPKGYSSLY